MITIKSVDPVSHLYCSLAGLGPLGAAGWEEEPLGRWGACRNTSRASRCTNTIDKVNKIRSRSKSMIWVSEANEGTGAESERCARPRAGPVKKLHSDVEVVVGFVAGHVVALRHAAHAPDTGCDDGVGFVGPAGPVGYVGYVAGYVVGYVGCVGYAVGSAGSVVGFADFVGSVGCAGYAGDAGHAEDAGAVGVAARGAVAVAGVAGLGVSGGSQGIPHTLDTERRRAVWWGSLGTGRGPAGSSPGRGSQEGSRGSSSLACGGPAWGLLLSCLLACRQGAPGGISVMKV